MEPVQPTPPEEKPPHATWGEAIFATADEMVASGGFITSCRGIGRDGCPARTPEEANMLVERYACQRCRHIIVPAGGGRQ